MLYDDYGSHRFVPLCINLWESWTTIKAYTSGYTYPVLRDGGSVWTPTA